MNEKAKIKCDNDGVIECVNNYIVGNNGKHIVLFKEDVVSGDFDVYIFMDTN